MLDQEVQVLLKAIAEQESERRDEAVAAVY